MPIDIGKLIQAEVEAQRLTYKEFGALINKNEKTVPDIYDRPTMSTDLLVTISVALKKDFLKLYYEEEGMKNLRNDQVAEMEKALDELKRENQQLKEKLSFMQELSDANKDRALMLTEKVVQYERIIKDRNKDADEPKNQS